MLAGARAKLVGAHSSRKASSWRATRHARRHKVGAALVGRRAGPDAMNFGYAFP